MKKGRNLSERERARQAAFDTLCENLKKEGYERKSLTLSFSAVNTVGILVMLPFVALLFVAFVCVNPETALSLPFPTFIFVIVWYVVLIVAHELIHGVMWALFAKSHFKAISFGMVWLALTPYCTCSEPLKKAQYVIGAAMPTLILGFGLGVLSVVIADFQLCELAMLLILGGGGDFLIILKMAFFRPNAKDVLYIDHPTDVGLAVFTR